ncbi:MAG: energy transducer TonB [Alphaproteobacteria bacterium]|nr:energy transducer TonB [Alphaproteobacteria bacterium]
MTVATFDQELIPGSEGSENPRRAAALSAALHVAALALAVFGLPALFDRPIPQDMPIAVQLVTIGPETRATHPNPYKPRAEAKSDAPLSPPAPKPEPKPELPKPVPEPPPSAAAPPTAAPAPKPEVKPPPPPPKPLDAEAPPPPLPRPEAKPKPEPEPRRPLRSAAKPEPKTDPAAFASLLRNLEEHKPDKAPKPDKPEPAAFDSLLKNLTRQQTAEAEEAPPQRPRPTSAAPPSSQPRAPLGAQLTASEMDLLREQLYHCWNIPAGARDAKDLVVEVRVAVNPDGTVRQAAIVDQGRLGDPLFRAAAESARRAFFNPQCTPLRVPLDKYETWKDLVVDFNPKDLL